MNLTKIKLTDSKEQPLDQSSKDMITRKLEELSLKQTGKTKRGKIKQSNLRKKN